MSTPREQYLAFQRFGFGARPGGRREIAADPRGAVLAELASREAAIMPKDDLPDASEALIGQTRSRELRRDYRKQEAERLRARREADAANLSAPDGTAAGGMAASGMDGADMAGDGMAGAGMAGAGMAGAGMAGAGMAGGRRGAKVLDKVKVPDDPAYRYPRDTYLREIGERLDRIKAARIGYVERLTAFWANHFAVSADKGQQLRVLAGVYEREAIRPHVLGRFRDMLGAVMTHPAMLIYLDNQVSVGPNSVFGQTRGKGLNENLARESLELHTLGVDGGYTQADVTSYAKVLTGWTIVPVRDPQSPGAFIFSAPRHEPGALAVLGRVYPAEGQAQGEKVLDAIARHPSTARHVARRLATAFVADRPSPGLVDRLAQVFAGTDGDLAAVARALAGDDDAWSAPTSKFRLPSEYIAAGLRALDVGLDRGVAHRALRSLGEEPWVPTSPQGFSLAGADWIAPDALTNRLDFAQVLAAQADPQADPRAVLADIVGEVASRETREAVARAESARQGVALLLMSPEFQRR